MLWTWSLEFWYPVLMIQFVTFSRCPPDVLMFETDDLVLRKNEKNVVLCLLEVARRASRFGMPAPVLIQLEQEIEEELQEQEERRLRDTRNLDEMVTDPGSVITWGVSHYSQILFCCQFFLQPYRHGATDTDFR